MKNVLVLFFAGQYIDQPKKVMNNFLVQFFYNIEKWHEPGGDPHLSQLKKKFVFFFLREFFKWMIL